MKKMIILIAVLFLLGMWVGINIAKDQPLFSNPFASRDIRDKAKDAAEKAIEQSKHFLQDKLKDQR